MKPDKQFVGEVFMAAGARFLFSYPKFDKYKFNILCNKVNIVL